MNTALPLRIRPFLAVTGTFFVAGEVIFAAVLLGGLAELWNTGRAETATNLLMMLLPFLAATGLIAAGRKGRLDFLLGAGAARASIWKTALLRAVVVPVVLTVLLALSLTNAAGMATMILRAGAAGAILGGIAFAGGMAGPRYLPGTLWIAARLVFMLSGTGRAFLSALRTGQLDAVHPLTTVAALAAIPELLLDPRMPLVAALPHLAVAIAAVAFSFHLIRRADLGGRRSE